ncbi:hypothetical protein [Microbispora sp. NPDC049125]|uniref:hypothetical protein n=1 Tax=Microbispora sp. NPDC049125 TaxID=3154929 RepID=UPI003465AB6B
MLTILLIFAPLIALIVWAAVFDLKRRRRGTPLSGHDIGSAAWRARGDAEGRGGGVDNAGGSAVGP